MKSAIEMQLENRIVALEKAFSEIFAYREYNTSAESPKHFSCVYLGNGLFYQKPGGYQPRNGEEITIVGYINQK